MLVTLITHPGDRPLALQLCQQIQALGGVSNHECLIVAPNGTDMTGIEDVLRESFGRLETHFYQDTMKGWPFGANEAAAAAMLHIHSSLTLKYHYLMLEPDCIPVHKLWLDRIDMEYRRCGMPILGVRIDTVEIDTRRVVGKHTVGVAVYPKTFPQICPLVRGLQDMTRDYQRQNAMPKPWDAYFGPYTAKLTAETQLIQHLSRVRNVDPQGGIHWDCPTVDNAMSQVRSEAVLIHGSKTPAFFTKLTGLRHAETKPSQHPKEPPRSEKTLVDRQDSVRPREEISPSGGEGNGVHQPGEPVRATLNGYSKNDKVRDRQIREKEAVRKEMGIEAPIDTPEFQRAAFFHCESKWAETRSYAAKNLRIAIFKMSKAKLINEIVRVESAQRKEPWTKVLPPLPSESKAPEPPVEEAPLPPVDFGISQPAHPAVAWTPVEGNAETAMEAVSQSSQPIISPAQQEKMRQLMADRGVS